MESGKTEAAARVFRLTKGWKIGVLVLIAAGILLFTSMQLKVSGEFTILPVQNAEIRSEVGGIIAAVHHDEGETVEKGTVIVELGDREIRAELDKVQAELAEKTAKSKLLKAGTRPEDTVKQAWQALD